MLSEEREALPETDRRGGDDDRVNRRRGSDDRDGGRREGREPGARRGDDGIGK